MKLELNGMFIKLALDKGIRDIRINSKRGIRGLVDLGRCFSDNEVKDKAFKVISDILEDDDSLYFDIIESLVENVNCETLKTVSYNLVYNSIIKGDKRLKNNSFIKNLDINKSLEIDKYKSLGVYSYILEINENTKLENIYEILRLNKDCTFILILNEYRSLDYSKLKENNNFIISINYLPGHEALEFEQILDAIKEYRFLYAIHYYVKNEEYILEDSFIKDIEKLDIKIAFIFNENKDEIISEYVVNSRWNLEYPIFLIDVYKDIEFVDELILSNKY